jgi:OFA family oxalate/formate antiporter-like MFS transporter
MFWGGVSDKIGRIQTFRIMLGTQIIAFMLLSKVSNPWIFQVLVCYVLLCYGGGFGTMPSFVTDVFGQKMMATVYGCILTAWSMGGLVGPQVVAVLKDYCRAHSMESEAASYSFLLGAGFLTVGFIASLTLTKKMLKMAAEVESVSKLKEDVTVGSETA